MGGVEGVRVVPTQAPPPPLVTLSLSFALSLNPKTHANEVIGQIRQLTPVYTVKHTDGCCHIVNCSNFSLGNNVLT